MPRDDLRILGARLWKRKDYTPSNTERGSVKHVIEMIKRGNFATAKKALEDIIAKDENKEAKREEILMEIKDAVIVAYESLLKNTTVRNIERQEKIKALKDLGLVLYDKPERK